jgi:hypothetical protein
VAGERGAGAGGARRRSHPAAGVKGQPRPADVQPRWVA